MSASITPAVFFAAISSLVLSVAASGQPQPPAYLRCEYLVEPRGVDADRPRLCWEVRDPRRGAVQSAFEIHVASTPASLAGQPDVWTSGKVSSSQTCHVEYAGPALQSGAAYFWAVRTWDADDQASPWSQPASFSMGLLKPGDWKASWIGDALPPPPARPARNGFHTQFAEQSAATRWVRIDLGHEQTIDAVRLWPARPHDFRPDSPGFCFPLRYRIEASSEKEPENWIAVDDRPDADQVGPGENPVLVAIPPTRARHVRLVVTALRVATPGRYAAALAEMQVLSNQGVVSTGAAVTASDSIETGEWSARNLTDGDTVSHAATGWEALPAPMFRKEFAIPGAVKRATLFISALGVYEATINGRRVGRQMLAPEWTDYATRVQYQAYDVTDLLRDGDNAIGVILGDGWYAGRLGMAQGFTPDKRPRGVYGRQPRLLAQMHVQRADGSVQLIFSDASWKSTLDVPIRVSDMLDGETYDARREIPRWNLPGFNEGESSATWGAAVVGEPVRIAVVAQPNEPIQVRETITPVALTEPRPGVFVFDLGQNMPGWCRIKVRGDARAVVTLRHAEALNDDGTLYTPNLRGAPQVDRYTLRGDPAGEEWEPRFTYHGFRFVEWTASGSCDKPSLDSLRGVVVCSDPPVVSSFECSNPMLNTLWSNILWTQHANMMSVPTDCPQRDERLGWMGDILAFAPNACFNKDMAAFLAKWSRDVRDSQADDGRFPDIAPHPYGKNERFTGVPAWGDAGVFVPWTAYLFYGDTRLLTEHFEAARRWVDWIRSRNPDLLWKHARHNDYNDWLNGDTLVQEGWPRTGGNVPNEVFATAFFARSTWIVSEMARVLGRETERARYADLYASIRAAFITNYVGDDAAMPGDTQAGYALALAFDLLPRDRRAAAVDRLVRGIEKYRGHLSTGFHSTHHAMIELTGAGRSDVAHQIAANDTFPSWGYSIRNGATTIWERWDGYVKGRGFQDPGMNSLNHWALGSVGEWMMRTIVGINNDPAAPAWSRCLIAPRPGGGLTHAAGTYRSIRGVIESSWRVNADHAVYRITIPPNAAALVRLPDASTAAVTESGAPIDGVPHVRIVRQEPATAFEGPALVLEVPAGSYEFRVRR